MEETSVFALLNLIEKTTHISAEVTFKEARPGEIDRSCLNNQFANRFLGWYPSTTLPIGIKKL
jgi:dTDP-D-glucose 4,6-dehydratase